QDPRQALDAAPARCDSEVHLRAAYHRFRIIRHETKMTHHRELASAAESIPVYRRDHLFRPALDTIVNVAPVRPPGDVRKIGYVHPCAEAFLTRSGNYNYPSVLALLQLAHHLIQLFTDTEVNRVSRRAVKRDCSNEIFCRYYNIIVV